MKYMPASNRIACDHGDDWFGKVLYRLLQIEGIQTRYTVSANIASVASNALIAARAERLVTCASEDCHAYLRVFTAQIEGIDQFCECFWPERIAYFGSVDGNFSHTV